MSIDIRKTIKQPSDLLRVDYNDMVKKHCKACENGYYYGCKGHIINWRLRYIVENTDEDIYGEICKLSWLERFYD